MQLQGAIQNFHGGGGGGGGGGCPTYQETECFGHLLGVIEQMHTFLLQQLSFCCCLCHLIILSADLIGHWHASSWNHNCSAGQRRRNDGANKELLAAAYELHAIHVLADTSYCFCVDLVVRAI